MTIQPRSTFNLQQDLFPVVFSYLSMKELMPCSINHEWDSASQMICKIALKELCDGHIPAHITSPRFFLKEHSFNVIHSNNELLKRAQIFIDQVPFGKSALLVCHLRKKNPFVRSLPKSPIQTENSDEFLHGSDLRIAIAVTSSVWKVTFDMALEFGSNHVPIGYALSKCDRRQDFYLEDGIGDGSILEATSSEELSAYSRKSQRHTLLLTAQIEGQVDSISTKTGAKQLPIEKALIAMAHRKVDKLHSQVAYYSRICRVILFIAIFGIPVLSQIKLLPDEMPY